MKIHRGFYTISLPQSIEVAKNDQIAVVFTIKNRNRNHIASIEVSESFDGYNYQTKEVTEPNQSFIKRANQNWKDMHEEQKVVRIQMLTNVDSENTVGTKALKESDMHLRDTLLTYSGECVEPIVIIDNDELKEMMHYGIRYENNLNVSESSRKLFVHRNTLVYRLDKSQKITGLDLRQFDQALIFKVAMMVKKYLESNAIKY